ncbi:AraC-like DNA-binding protein [Fontibacillus phaseoli]|uniref:AraC-like DNA-binding protein n=1 Tax=Fontibacillus phaseoli TaxID=1416533 RepID=A0A369BDA3_9BACL|nr:AraC family transcriptional regulator [Fontibacillus phaseoli]RCX18588.1 AraC-like DNA-binding protein [Fontibacillus phaseoli]
MSTKGDEHILNVPNKYFFTPTSFEKSSGAWPVRIGISEAKVRRPAFKSPRIEPHYSLIFILDGEGIFIQKGKKYQLRRNDLFGVFPQVPHEYFSVECDPMHYIRLTFEGSQCVQLLERIGIKRCTPIKVNGYTSSALLHLRELIVQAENTGDRDRDLVRLSTFLQLFRSLSRHVPDEIRNIDCSDEWLERGREHMELHYSEDISIESIARYVGIERSYFSRKFKTAYGITPLKYLQNIRIHAAKKLLETTDLSLAAIAPSVGYVDIFSFSKAFKKNTGISPVEYRAAANRHIIASKKVNLR